MKLFINKTGYLDGSLTANNPYNIIPGGNITMEGVSKEILAIPVKDNKILNPIIMRPDRNYNFNSDYVVEIPKAQLGQLYGVDPNYLNQILEIYNQNQLYDPATQTTNINSTNVDPAVNMQLLQDLSGLTNKGLQESNFDSRFDNILNTGTNQIATGTNNGDTKYFIPADENVGGISNTEVKDTEISTQKIPSASVFNNIMTNPALYGGVDLSSALFGVGKSIGFNANNPQQNRANIGRGIGYAGKSLLNIGRLIGSGLGYSNRLNTMMDSYNDAQRRALVNNFNFAKGGMLQHFKNGGTVEDFPIEKILTGEYITGLPKAQENLANVEIENKEWVKHPNNDVQLAVGNTHDEDGIKVFLDPGTKIISNYLKIDKGFKNFLKDEFDLKLTTKNSYADAIAKYTQKIGLNKLIEEQEGRFKELNKQRDVDHQATKNINAEFLSGKIKDIEDEKQLLETKRADFTDKVFEEQEDGKSEEDRKPQFKEGGTVGFKKLCKKYGISEQRGRELFEMAKGGELYKAQTGVFPTYSQVNNSFADPSLFVNQSQVGSSGLFGEVNPDNFLERIKETLRIFPEAKRFLNLETDSSGNITSASFKDDNSVRNFQNYVQEVYGNLIDYSTESDLFNDSNRGEFTNYVNSLMFDDAIVARNIDNRFGNFTSSRGGVGLQLVGEKELSELNKDGITNFSQLFDTDGNLKSSVDYLSDDTKNRLLDIRGKFENKFEAFLLPKRDKVDIVKPESKSPASPIPTVEEVVPPTEEPTAEDIGEVYDPGLDLQTINRLGFPILPDQSALPPNGITPHLMIDRTFQRLDPVEISIEDNLKEINRNQNFATQQLNQLPDSQRRAALANLIANSEESINKTITSVEAQNALNRQQTEQFNIQQSNLEENYRAADSLDFERRSLTALAKTQEDIARYFDFNRRVRLGNFNTVHRMNLLNNLYENFGTDFSGGIALKDNGLNSQVANNILRP